MHRVVKCSLYILCVRHDLDNSNATSTYYRPVEHNKRLSYTTEKQRFSYVQYCLSRLAKGENKLHQFLRLCHVSVVSRRFPHSITRTLGNNWQLPRLRGSYGETCVMDFG